MAEAFRMLGSLLSDKADRGQELADLVDYALEEPRLAVGEAAR